MESRLRIAVRTFCVLSFLLVPGLSRPSHAAPIELDNNVDISWQQKAYANFFPTVVNGNFVVTNQAELDAVLIAILVNRTDLLGGFELTLNLFDPLSNPEPNKYDALLVNGLALTLTFASGQDNSGQNLDNITDPDFTKPTYNKQWTLNDFLNPLQTFDEFGVLSGPSTDDVLLGLLANGPIGFSLDGHFFGSNSLPVDLACQLDPTVCKTFPGSASITESGGQPFHTVPEPGSLSLLLVGITGIAGLRRRRS